MPSWVQIRFDTNDVSKPAEIVGASDPNPNGKYYHEKDYDHFFKLSLERGVLLTRIGIKINALEYMVQDGDDGIFEKIGEIQGLTHSYMPVEEET